MPTLLSRALDKHRSIYQPVDLRFDEIIYAFEFARKASHAEANKWCHIERLALPTFLED